MNKQTKRSWRLANALMIMLAALFLAPVSAFAAPRPAEAAKGLTWMTAQQQADGGFPGFGVGSTADAVYALAAAGRYSSDPATSRALEYLRTNAANYAKSPGAAAKLALALAATGWGSQASNFGGVDLLGMMQGSYSNGAYGGDLTGHALVVLALKALGQQVPDAASAWLIQRQGQDGGWAFDGSTGAGTADTNTTGTVLQALSATGGNWNDARTRAIAYLHAQQNADGGFTFMKAPGNESDANSTATAILGIIAAGEDPESAAWTMGGSNPVAYLLTLQNASGAFRYQNAMPDDNGGATYQAVQAALAAPLPIVAEAGAQPGMPRTGEGADLLLLLALAAGALGLAGVTLRRSAAKAA